MQHNCSGICHRIILSFFYPSPSLFSSSVVLTFTSPLPFPFPSFFVPYIFVPSHSSSSSSYPPIRSRQCTARVSIFGQAGSGHVERTKSSVRTQAFHDQTKTQVCRSQVCHEKGVLFYVSASFCCLGCGRRRHCVVVVTSSSSLCRRRDCVVVVISSSPLCRHDVIVILFSLFHCHPILTLSLSSYRLLVFDILFSSCLHLLILIIISCPFSDRAELLQ